jgi:glyoxylase-like metal-dependent hydrolase (beta-lactamase superfamily II)
MVSTFTRSTTARKLWALPGAYLNALRAPVFEGGVVKVTDASPVISMPCPSFLIEHDRGLVLFDTGVSPKGLKDPKRHIPVLAGKYGMTTGEELAIDSQLKGLGLAPSKVKYVIASHLHFDHAGGLYLFSDSTLLVGAGEWSHAYAPRSTGHHPEFLTDLIETLGFDWIELPGDYDLFGDGSVLILRTPGHTPGELSLVVRLPNRTVVLTGDTCHYRVELEHGLPAQGYCADVAKGTQSIRRLQMVRDAYDADVWIGHDVGDWARLPHAPEHIE